MNDKTEMTQEAARPKRKFGPSTVARLQVARVSEMGAFLDAQTGNTSDDILLHKTQQTHPVAVGDFVDVFLYLDPKRRLTASMRVPKMKEGQIARLRVINVSRDGAFVDVGAERGIFMPYAGMRGRPQVGEVVWAKLYTDKSGRLAVTMEVEDEMRRASKPATHVKVGQMVTGAIYNYTDAGAFLFSNERYIVFIANKEMKDNERPRVGEVVTARHLRPPGRAAQRLAARGQGEGARHGFEPHPRAACEPQGPHALQRRDVAGGYPRQVPDQQGGLQAGARPPHEGRPRRGEGRLDVPA